MNEETCNTLLREMLGYYPKAKGVEVLLALGDAHGRGGAERLDEAIELLVVPKRYALAVRYFFSPDYMMRITKLQ